VEKKESVKRGKSTGKKNSIEPKNPMTESRCPRSRCRAVSNRGKSLANGRVRAGLMAVKEQCF